MDSSKNDVCFKLCQIILYGRKQEKFNFLQCLNNFSKKKIEYAIINYSSTHNKLKFMLIISKITPYSIDFDKYYFPFL